AAKIFGPTVCADAEQRASAVEQALGHHWSESSRGGSLNADLREFGNDPSQIAGGFIAGHDVKRKIGRDEQRNVTSRGAERGFLDRKPGQQLGDDVAGTRGSAQRAAD